MKHYRIIEKIGTQQKEYTVQYLKSFIGLQFWKKLNKKTYQKYNCALSEVKKIIKKDDYQTSKIGYHYIDAYKLFKREKNQ